MDTKLADARNFLDLNGLNSIREQSRGDDKASKDAALKEAAQQFEGIFMQMLLKSMRQAEDVLASDSPFNSQSTKFYRDMQDQQMALEMSTNGTLGLSDLIVRQLGGDDSFTSRSVLRTENNDFSVRNAQVNAKSGELDQLAQQFFNLGQASNNRHQNNSNAVEANEQTKKDVSNSPQYKDPKDFVTALSSSAKNVQQSLGVPFEVVIAQAALETGWGQKIIKNSEGQSSNNLFNIKADQRWGGDKTSKETLEYEQGTLVKKNEPFRVYQTIEDSLSDYVSFLSTGERYQDALSKPDNVEHFLHGLQKAGYATDPNYANKILGTLRKVTSLLSD
ncbi:flagellar assembly peptidoglycan hydrolase FlgJ [Thalassotalea atypica]|uniref:flagellar assembly peptidoglycan hydrolase FlgJ n=1 Tax=Thalassotalea atypica TaxID=2054316 RepID=UPI0025732DDB|nr:flagellar assembly peptidoglycan hydrolase FlgJ [Thalassotalea atypica]